MLLSTTKALLALHRVLIKTRYLAQSNLDRGSLIDILDYAEFLAQCLTEGEDRLAEFEAQLKGLGSDHPEFAGIWRDYELGTL